MSRFALICYSNFHLFLVVRSSMRTWRKRVIQWQLGNNINCTRKYLMNKRSTGKFVEWLTILHTSESLLNVVLIFRIFLVDLLNFSFWSDLDRDDTGNCPDRFSVSFNDQLYTGYWSLCAAINRGKLYKNVFIYA